MNRTIGIGRIGMAVALLMLAVMPALCISREAVTLDKAPAVMEMNGALAVTGEKAEGNLFLMSGIEHAMASGAQDVVKTARFIETKVLPALQAAKANEATVETLTGLVSPQAANIERGAYALLGVAIKAIQDANQAGAAGGMNLALDASLVADLKAIAPAVRASVSIAGAAASA